MTTSAPSFQICRTPPQSLASFALGTGRVIALFFAGFSILNLGGELLHAGFDANGWWLDTRVLPEPVSHLLMLAFSVLLFQFARQPAGSKSVLCITEAGCRQRDSRRSSRLLDVLQPAESQCHYFELSAAILADRRGVAVASPRDHAPAASN